MIPRRLRFYWAEGATSGTAEDISNYSDWLASQDNDVGAHTGKKTGKANSLGGMVRQKIGPATGIYDPELAATLALDGNG
jgi:hypothetical protein